MKKYSLGKFIRDFYIVLVLIFLYVPIAVMAVLSFNNTKSRNLWGGFTLKWYSELFTDPTVMNALYNTLIIAFVSAFTATVIGTLAAFGLNSMKRRPRSLAMGLSNLSLVNPEIVTGVSMMLVFIAFGMSFGFKTVLIAHITFNIPFVLLSVMPKLRNTDREIYEVAMDLGANPVQVFFRVALPDILPGVLSGFLLAFTMSLDDFTITHFTRGAGIDTLSTLIYGQIRRGIKPTMYALSTLIFVVVMLLLILTNYKPDLPKEKRRVRKFILVTSCFAVMAAASVSTYRRYYTAHSEELYIYCWGEYFSDEVLEQFEEETGIHVVYDIYESNEEMYPVIEAGAVSYDVICPSDYMIEKMIQNGMLTEIDFSNVPNIKNIDAQYLEKSTSFDPGNRYSVPYIWGTVGIVYNKKLLDEMNAPAPVKWEDLWNPAYKGELLMRDSVRDTFMVALKTLGCSMNSEDPGELEQAKDLLIAQKPFVQAYVEDEVFDKMLGGEAAVGVIYSAEMLYIQGEAENAGIDFEMEYVQPEEGTNIWFDSWVIPWNAKNKENAEKWINFLCRPDITKKNFEFTPFSTPNGAARELLDKDFKNNEVIFPDAELLENCEVFKYMGDETDALYNSLWKEIKSN